MSLISSRPFIIAGTFAALSGVGGYAWHESHRPKALEVRIFDTPGIPSIFVRTPDDRRLLIDGGSNAEVLRYLTDALPFYSRRIDTLVVTKPEGERVTGLIDVLNRYTVDEVIVPGINLFSNADRIYNIFLETVKGKNISIKNGVAEDKIILGKSEESEVIATILFPMAANEFEYSKASAPELLMRIDYGRTSLALIGKATPKIQRAIVNGSTEPVDVMVVSQSPIASNLSKELINTFKPEHIVYSQTLAKTASKKPSYDPIAGILKERRFNIKKSGTIRIISDGQKVTVD
jgi:beta-lactamase superfamily II metal-dependent hydrolase